ncbi:hypothetical protein C5Q97_15250 [Victivallales bacterium CCUG 44730]|nr:hypothetical protein C5Q97_15250 [Victivallales bacterium CCUG 44730]
MDAKYLQITESIKRQIRNGDYLIEKVPSERKLADSFGVSYMTARRAVQQLIEDRFFLRCENGRLAIGPAAVENAGRLNVVLVLPNWPIPSLDKWRKALYELVRERNGVLKTVYFDHEDDNVIQEALTGDFSRVFLELPVIPELTRQRLCGMRDKVVLLQHDLTDFGLTCLDAASPENMGLLVDHLHMLGHRKIALLNTQPLNEVITGRIEVFRRRSVELGLEHQFFNAPVNTFERADHKAYELAGGIIRRNCFSGTGIVTTTIEAAIGTLRAVHDNGMRPGKEISVCAYGGLESARLSIPSITVICATDIERQCRNLLCDILDRRTPERLLYSWEKMSIWQGESSGPVLPR